MYPSLNPLSPSQHPTNAAVSITCPCHYLLLLTVPSPLKLSHFDFCSTLFRCLPSRESCSLCVSVSWFVFKPRSCSSLCTACSPCYWPQHDASGSLCAVHPGFAVSLHLCLHQPVRQAPLPADLPHGAHAKNFLSWNSALLKPALAPQPLTLTVISPTPVWLSFLSQCFL